MMTRDEVAAKYGITSNDEGELDYACDWEADHRIGYEPINHNAPRMTAKQVMLVAQLNSEGY